MKSAKLVSCVVDFYSTQQYFPFHNISIRFILYIFLSAGLWIWKFHIGDKWTVWFETGSAFTVDISKHQLDRKEKDVLL